MAKAHIDLAEFPVTRKGEATAFPEPELTLVGQIPAKVIPPIPASPPLPAPALAIDGRTVAMTLRLDAGRYHRLMEFGAAGREGRLRRRPNQEILIEALDLWLAKQERAGG